MGIRIVTDSASDLNIDIEKKYNIEIVPLTVNFDSQSYKDRVEITSEEFFNKLDESKVIPSTSQVNPKEFEDVFKSIIDEGDEILGIFLSSHLSGTYNAALIAKDMLKSNQITIIDSQMVSLSEGLLVYKAAVMASQGKSVNDIVEYINQVKESLKTIIVVDTLDYLRKGGRLTASQAFIGGILNLKPILTMSQGKLVPLNKVRGRKKTLQWINNWLKENNVDLTDKTIYIVHARDEKYLEELETMLIEEFGVKDIIKSEVGAIVGTHSGPGAIGMCFIPH
ncbi:DegV family EDD domain-containing protein [Alkalibaculum sp. M08DMB]|uniref:DegV family EDD domain-containing protein n=1 Tax=Alkalibaculum sporogenes TaxID=2655001 RepID=A0A6A7K5E3_9FIRM|nr:DegV family protein [Alkalibaculum sporogenes]MPW24602.1 DegV family EDD domain-containing protein [Alkalibaculum sporogenes]